MIGMPTKALGIPYVGNKWAHMAMFRDMLPARPTAYMDLTFGCGICSVFMSEIGVRKFVANDASPYPRLIAEALLGNNAKRLSDFDIAQRVDSRMYKVGGYGSETLPKGAFRRRTACHIDAVIQHNQDSPLMLVAIGSVLSTGAMVTWRYGYTKHLTPESFTSEVRKKARRLNARVVTGCSTRITNTNYLKIGKLANVKNHVVYLDPAWPQPPGEKKQRKSQGDVYGFYAQQLMSLLRQEELPIPPQYDVDYYGAMEGMRDTILKLRENNHVLIAYQAFPNFVDDVKARLFEGLEIVENAEQRKSGTGLWEYLWRVL